MGDIETIEPRAVRNGCHDVPQYVNYKHYLTLGHTSSHFIDLRIVSVNQITRCNCRSERLVNFIQEYGLKHMREDIELNTRSVLAQLVFSLVGLTWDEAEEDHCS